MEVALVGFRGVGSASCDQGGDERAKQGFAATACVVHELEEPQIERQLLLRDPPVRAEPGAQQGPEPLDRVDGEAAGRSGRGGARVYRVSAFLGLVTNEPRKAEGCSQWSFMDAFATPARLRA